MAIQRSANSIYAMKASFPLQVEGIVLSRDQVQLALRHEKTQGPSYQLDSRSRHSRPRGFFFGRSGLGHACGEGQLSLVGTGGRRIAVRQVRLGDRPRDPGGVPPPQQQEPQGRQWGQERRSWGRLPLIFSVEAYPSVHKILVGRKERPMLLRRRRLHSPLRI